jgi:thermitase
LLIKVKPGTDIDALAKSLSAKVVGRDDKMGIYRLQFEDEAATEVALAKLKTNASVESVDYNYIYDVPVVPRAVSSSATGPVSLTLDANSKNDPCHPIVGLIDTGIQSLGSQLDPFIMQSISVTGDSASVNSPSPTHATSMAETILRAVSQQGSSSSVRILPVDVYGSSEMATTWNVALGVKAAVDGGATILNMSLGSGADSQILSSIIAQAQATGVIVFAAAGNQPVNTPTYPAAISGVNAVTALGAPGQIASYANYGSFVNMALPGASVVYLNGQAYVVQGTSPATAYASGVAAGYKGINCDSWAQIQRLMQQKFPVPQK